MAHGKKAEASVAFLLDKLNNFRSVANLTKEVRDVVDDVSSALRQLEDIVKPLDEIKPDDSLATGKQSLDDELHQLTQEIFPFFDRETTPKLQTRRPSPGAQLQSLKPILSKLKGISDRYRRLCDWLERKEGSATERHHEAGEGSSVTKSPTGDSVLTQPEELNQQISTIFIQKDRLAPCLLYLGIFPKNYLINCARVSRFWTAEGFLGSGSDYSPEGAESVLQELHHRKWIHPVETRSDGGFSAFRVDNHVREIIVSLSDRHKLVGVTSEGISNWPVRVRCLSFQLTFGASNEEKPFQPSSIIMLDVSSNEDNTTTSEALPMATSETPSVPSRLKHSKVLDLTGAPFQIIPDELSELTDLRYLSIRNTSIRVIPGSIRKLRRLEYLDAKHSMVTKLPQQVAKLERIRHILIYHHEKDTVTESYSLIGFKALCRVRRLKCLEKLCFVEANEQLLIDLRNLTKLRRLGITKLREEHGELLCSSLEKLERLESLNLHAFDEDEIIDLCYSFLPPKNLKRLYLHGRLEKLPDWISSLNNLTKFLLRWSQLEVDLLATLGKLPKLVELELRRAYDGERLDFEKGQFPKLKILLLEELEGLRSMSLEQGTLPSLENLTISRCPWLERIPSGVERIHSIRKLTFFDMSCEFYEMVRMDNEKDDYEYFKHIPEVYFTQRRAGHWETHPIGQTVGKAQRNILKKDLKPNRKLQIAKEKLKFKPEQITRRKLESEAVDTTITKEKRRSEPVDIFSVTEHSKFEPVDINIAKGKHSSKSLDID